ncbi:MAG TPA: hypothetical protein VLT36_09840 [Candidatus Dormibacteraeota bacterium]|nr:hypothetical protein [Candidatus Dormibacteraeota bacterium]
MKSKTRAGNVFVQLLKALWLLSILIASAISSQAALQFDVFPGYDGIIPEAAWFPIVCEIKNDGPSFNGIIEVTPGNYNQGQMRRVVVELPTGTLKRLVIPIFSSTRGYSTWDVRLLDERGKMRAEQPGLRATKQLAAGTPLMGSLTRTAGGTPSLKPILPQQSEMQPAAARLQTSIFPDNPLVLEGMDSLYLSSEKASELRVPNQVEALFAWLNAGGHLIVGIEQIADVNSTKWLRELLPVELKDIRTVQRHPEFQDWLKNMTWNTNAPRVMPNRSNPYPAPRQRNRAATPAPETPTSLKELADDFTFETASMQIATGTVKDGHVVVSAEDSPLIVTANRGRGQVTVLMFSPEREPFRSWKHLQWFWSKIGEVPAEWYASKDFSNMGGLSSDGIFGAMIDSRQVHKLPVEWLLVLLIVYLVVIGPLDQFWLKKINRPMLTWITFPCYVVMFSLLIYFIGYKLRAGESEWNELHLIDVLAQGEKSELRGRTYASVYAPANEKYELQSQLRYATLRGEYASTFYGGNGQSGEKATVTQIGDTFKAEIFVPVWTSQLFVSDWCQPASTPVNAVITPRNDGWEVKVDNHTDHKLVNAQVVIENQVMKLGEIPANENRTFTLSRGQGTALRDFVWNYGSAFQNVVQQRQHAFGRENGQLTDLPNCTIAASFISQLRQQENNYMGNFVAPPGLDMSQVIEHGGAVLFAWADDYAPVKSLYQIKPRRAHKNTMWRIPVPVQGT